MSATGTATGTVPARSRPVFHRLRVAAVDALTDDAVAVTFDVPDHLREAYRFTAGQHLTLRRVVDGEDVRRSYSICAPAGSGVLRIAVRRLAGGRFSEWATTRLRAGDEVDVLTPAGRFGATFAAGRSRHYGAIAAGSGITPILSVLATGLQVEPDSRFTLVYGNRTAASVMFLEEIADLKDRHPDRFQVVHILSRERHDAPLLSGRIDADKLRTLLREVVPTASVDEWFLCGPEGLVDEARRALLDAGSGEAVVHRELFQVDGAGAVEQRRDAPGPQAPAGPTVAITLDGRRSTVDLLDAGEPLLDGVLRVRRDTPFACRGGVCGTCRARVMEGEVSMVHQYALDAAEVAAGYVLTCQATATTDRVVVDFDV